MKSDKSSKISWWNKINQRFIKKKNQSFSLLLITTSNKLQGVIDFNKIHGSQYSHIIKLDDLKEIINDSRYFLIESKINDILEEANTNLEIPDFSKENNFILKITGQSTIDISKYSTKSWLLDNITSETCKIEKVLRLLDVSIAEKFAPTI